MSFEELDQTVCVHKWTYRPGGYSCTFCGAVSKDVEPVHRPPTDPPLDLEAIRRVCEQTKAHDHRRPSPFRPYSYLHCSGCVANDVLADLARTALPQLLTLVEEAQARIERLIDACEAVAHGGANHPDFTERCSFCEQPWNRHEDDCEIALSLSLARAWLARVSQHVDTPDTGK